MEEIFLCLFMFDVLLFSLFVSGLTRPGQCLNIVIMLQFTLEDARDRLNSLHQSPDRRQRLDPGSAREQRHSIHVLTTSPSSASSTTPSSTLSLGESCSVVSCKFIFSARMRTQSQMFKNVFWWHSCVGKAITMFKLFNKPATQKHNDVRMAQVHCHC